MADTGVGGSSGDGGAASAAQLNDPFGLSVDNNGNVYIADKSNSKIRKINGAGITAALQTSYPAASMAAPIVITITASPTATPTTAPSTTSSTSTSGAPPSAELSVPPPSTSTSSVSATTTSSSGGSLVVIIAGAAGGGGFLLLLGLGFLFYRRHAFRKSKESQILAGSSDSADDGGGGGGGVNYEIEDADCGIHGGDNMSGSGSKKIQFPITPVGITIPSINFSGTTTTTGIKQPSTVTSTVTAIGGSTITYASGGGANQSIASSAVTPTQQFESDSLSPKAAASPPSTLPSIEWSTLTPSKRIGSGAFSAVCKLTPEPDSSLTV